jgi:hypothetical protein
MSTRPATAFAYGTKTVYGPFHRRTKTGVSPARLPRQILRDGELWGRGPKNSPIPAAMAYFGALPGGKSGFEFYSLVEPDGPYGSTVYWHAPPYGHARADDPWAKIDVLMCRVSEDTP